MEAFVISIGVLGAVRAAVRCGEMLAYAHVAMRVERTQRESAKELLSAIGPGTILKLDGSGLTICIEPPPHSAGARHHDVMHPSSGRAS